MHYSTEWVVLLLVVGCFAGTAYQCYLAGHLWLLVPTCGIGILVVAIFTWLERRR